MPSDEFNAAADLWWIIYIIGSFLIIVGYIRLMDWYWKRKDKRGRKR